MAKAKKSPDWEAQLNEFFQSTLADKAGSYLSERATIALHVQDETFLYRRKKDVNVIEKVSSAKVEADVRFWVPPSALRHLLTLSDLPGTGLGTMGVAIFEHLFSSDPEKKIKFRVDTGFLGLWAKGYFSVLKAGGPEVASYVAQKGFNSVTRIKEVLKNIRG